MAQVGRRVQVVISEDVMKQVDHYAVDQSCTKAQAMERLIECGLGLTHSQAFQGHVPTPRTPEKPATTTEERIAQIELEASKIPSRGYEIMDKPVISTEEKLGAIMEKADRLEELALSDEPLPDTLEGRW
jgi:hypothetical protein